MNAVDESRAEHIEARVAHQEHLLAELSEVLYRQQKQIDQLTASLEKLSVDYRELLEHSRATQAPGDEPPPHY